MADVSQHNIVFRGANSEYNVPLKMIWDSLGNVTYKPVFDFLAGEKKSEDINVEEIPQMIDSILMRSAITQRDYNEAEPPTGKKFNIVI